YRLCCYSVIARGNCEHSPKKLLLPTANLNRVFRQSIRFSDIIDIHGHVREPPWLSNVWRKEVAKSRRKLLSDSYLFRRSISSGDESLAGAACETMHA